MHVVCALCTPGVYIQDVHTLRKVVGVPQAISRSRLQRITCSVCGKADGACVECCCPDCPQRFHALCAWYAGLSVRVSSLDDGRYPGRGLLEVYCQPHTPESEGGTVRRAELQKIMRRRALLSMQRQRKVARGRPSTSALPGTRGGSASGGRKEDVYEAGRCAVCMEAYSTPHDTLVHCTRCGIDVHQLCYGISEADMAAKVNGSTSNWQCARCSVAGSRYVECALCPRKGGAFKVSKIMRDKR